MTELEPELRLQSLRKIEEELEELIEVRAFAPVDDQRSFILQSLIEDAVERAELETEMHDFMVVQELAPELKPAASRKIRKQVKAAQKS